MLQVSTCQCTELMLSADKWVRNDCHLLLDKLMGLQERKEIEHALMREVSREHRLGMWHGGTERSKVKWETAFSKIMTAQQCSVASLIQAVQVRMICDSFNDVPAHLNQPLDVFRFCVTLMCPLCKGFTWSELALVACASRGLHIAASQQSADCLELSTSLACCILYSRVMVL